MFFYLRKMKKALVLLSVYMLGACTVNTENQINDLISQMTLEEKVSMLHGQTMFSSGGVERLGIAPMKYADGPFGVREELEPHSWAPIGWTTDSATFFPTGSALAATWSEDMAYKYGKTLAAEARTRGKDMILGPAINIQRIPTGGRTYEYLSEDPFLSARLAVGYVRGVQENGAAACVKHYALNNQENSRGIVDVIVSERAMREIYLEPFRAAVMEGGALGVMAAYNKVGGQWCSENDLLQNRILRDEWGFRGMIVSDWGGTHSTVDAAMNGLDVLIFTGGVGENMPIMRSLACRDLDALGIRLDEEANSHFSNKIEVLSAADSRVTVLKVPTNEELMIALETQRLLS